MALVVFFPLLPLVNSHMLMSNPPSLKYKGNPNSVSPDYSLTAPLMASGSDFPCKGYHKLLGKPEGKSVATWAAGSSQSFTIEGGAIHNGGSCQASLSYDGGKTFKVIKSFIGNCPMSLSQKFPITIPVTAPASTGNGSLFAWTWFNQVGNREMYMDCAVVTITGGSGGSLDDLPDLFVANVGNGCSTTEGTDVVFPNPGKVVDNVSKAPGPPVGTCQKAVAAPPPAPIASVPMPISSSITSLPMFPPATPVGPVSHGHDPLPTVTLTTTMTKTVTTTKLVTITISPSKSSTAVSNTLIIVTPPFTKSLPIVPSPSSAIIVAAAPITTEYGPYPRHQRRHRFM
ncbi:MAG: hypothetical protein M1829_006807 [Trizodia sp. TS-e1964]|nr:MAG: hypothetical protein M1829_006807 [Trizodia sp. TS-e1964]